MSLEHKEYCIIGIGKFSLELANNLLNANASVVLIDSNHEKITELSSKYQYVYEIDARDIDSLESLNLKDFSKVIVGVSKMEDSILIVSNLKKLGVENIIANVKNDVQKEVLNILGGHKLKTIWPDEILAELLAFRIVNDLELDLSMNDDGIAIIKLPVKNEQLFGWPISKFEIKSDFLTNIIKIIRDGDVIFPVRSTTVLLKGDVITVACAYSSLNKVVNFFTKQ